MGKGSGTEDFSEAHHGVLGHSLLSASQTGEKISSELLKSVLSSFGVVYQIKHYTKSLTKTVLKH